MNGFEVENKRISQERMIIFLQYVLLWMIILQKIREILENEEVVVTSRDSSGYGKRTSTDILEEYRKFQQEVDIETITKGQLEILYSLQIEYNLSVLSEGNLSISVFMDYGDFIGQPHMVTIFKDSDGTISSTEYTLVKGKRKVVNETYQNQQDFETAYGYSDFYYLSIEVVQ